MKREKEDVVQFLIRNSVYKGYVTIFMGMEERVMYYFEMYPADSTDVRKSFGQSRFMCVMPPCATSSAGDMMLKLKRYSKK